MPELAGSSTEADLLAAFARESQAAMRYRFFAQQADVEGEPEIARRFRSLADGATGHALGHLDLLAELPDRELGHPLDEPELAVAATVVWEQTDHHDTYPAARDRARSAGLVEVADWFEAVAKAGHATHFDDA